MARLFNKAPDEMTLEEQERYNQRWRLLHPPPVRWVTNFLIRTLGRYDEGLIASVWSAYWFLIVLCAILVAVMVLKGT